MLIQLRVQSDPNAIPDNANDAVIWQENWEESRQSAAAKEIRWQGSFSGRGGQAPPNE